MLRLARSFPKVLEKVLIRNPRQGGKLMIVYGEQGSGKTTILETIAWAVKLLYPEEIVMWRGQKSCMWADFLATDLPVRVIYSGPEPIFVDAWTGRPAKLDIELVGPISPSEMLDACDSDYVNVIYIYTEGPKGPIDFATKWLDLLRALEEQPHGWVSLLFDEVEDLAPANPKGTLWSLVEEIAQTVKEFRKNWVSFYAATQNYFDVDYRLRGKMQFRMYLKGAVAPPRSRVWQRAIDSLSLGEGWLEGGKYEFFVFAEFPHGPELKVLNYR